MQMQLLQGEFEPQEAKFLLTQLVHAKITFHEGKIGADSPEEEIKMRESRIKALQHELYDVCRLIDQKGNRIMLDGIISVS